MAELYSCITNRGSLLDVERLIGQGQDINYVNVNDDNMSILHRFCWCYGEKAGEETLKILELLIEKGAVVDAVDKSDQTPLMLLVWKGFSVDHVGLLLRKGADIMKRKTANSVSVLFYLGFMNETKIGKNSLNVLKLLIENGAVVDAVTDNGHTPLTWLVYKGFPLDHVEILLKNGASVHHISEGSKTVLYFFALGYNSKIGDHSLKILKLFVKYGCDVDSVNNAGDTPLKLLLEKKFPAEYLEVLLRKTSQVNRKLQANNILLHRFVSLYAEEKNKSLEILKVLIRFNSDVDFVNQNGDTPIKLLVEKKFPAKHLRVALSKSADINRKYAGGNTIFHHFIEAHCSNLKEESLSMMEVLVEEGASVDIANEEGDTPLMLLMKKRFPINHLAVAICTSNDINCKDKSGDTLMHHFTERLFDIDENSLKKILSLLLDSGGSVDIPNEKGDTPLMLLLRKGFPFDCVKLAVMQTKDINCKDVSGNTLIHHFIKCYSFDIGEESLKLLRLLVDSGASVDIRNEEGDIPLMILLKNLFPVDHMEVTIHSSKNLNYKDPSGNTFMHHFIEFYQFDKGDDSLKLLCLLLESGASVDILNEKGETPLMLLLKRKYPVDHLDVAIRRSKDINYKDASGNTLMHYFIKCYQFNKGDNSLKLLSLLLESGASVDVQNEKGEMSLRLLLEKGYPVNHLRLALSASQDVNHKDKDDNNLLHDFVRLYHLETGEVRLSVLKSLIQFGVSVDTINKNGETPLKLLLKKGFPLDYLEVAISTPCNVSSDETLLHYFVECYRSKINDESLKVLELLVASRANVHALNKNEETLFMVFLKHRFPFDHIKVILDKGADVRGPFGNYPNVLHYLLWTGNRFSSKDLFRLMLEYGVDPNEVDEEGTPILFSCIRANNVSLARILCEHGSEIDWDTRWGRDIISNYLKYVNHMDGFYETIFKYALLRDDKSFDRFFDNLVGDVGKLRRFVNASVKELAEMRCKQLNERVIVYDFLSETDQRTLGEYLWLDEVGAGVEAALEAGFPVYSDIIQSRLETARRWAEIYKNLHKISSMSVVSTSGIEVELNHYCVQHIARFLNNYHLQKFISTSVFDLTTR